jgi:hypothetical protein
MQIKVACPVCGVTRWLWPSQIKLGKRFCSRVCAYQGRRVSYSKTPIADRFWAKVHKTDTCWLWIGTKGRTGGYGSFQIGRQSVLAHRYAYEATVGPIPDGMNLLHKCDTPACVNPGHLWPGTQQENVLDSVEKGRWPCGVQHTRAKLTEGDVRHIRQLRKEGATQMALAELFGVARSTIRSILIGRNWKHLS